MPAEGGGEGRESSTLKGGRQGGGGRGQTARRVTAQVLHPQGAGEVREDAGARGHHIRGRQRREKGCLRLLPWRPSPLDCPTRSIAIQLA